MTFNEYALCARGYFLRQHRGQEGLRELYRLIWNCNSDKASKIRSNGELQMHWPLITDVKNSHSAAVAIDKERWLKNKAINDATRKMIKNQIDVNKHTETRN